ncbi:MAG TPA: RNA 2',3'-cyclic phosphodiesterase [Magnetospirillum sp.]|nr:RNA 2',3'-cyclic phosphodiesterase [Magnetospirillum sp.]
MIRLFTGVALPDDLTRRLESLVGGIPGARWIEARNLHVTLCFIGEVEEGLAAELDEALVALRAPRFQLSLHGFGTFGRAKPNHLWAAVDKAPGLLHLQAKVEAAVSRAGVVPEGRKYVPHVTLARFKDAPLGRIQDFIARNSPLTAEPWPVDRFILYRSHLGRSGAEYEALAEYPLE